MPDLVMLTGLAGLSSVIVFVLVPLPSVSARKQ